MDRENYRKREQTYLKHHVLKNYLERLAYIIGVSFQEVCFVDCFAGPWESELEEYEDCSVKISIDTLNEVKRNLKKQGYLAEFKAIFNEKDKESYKKLTKIISSEDEITTVALLGEFEENIHDILNQTENRFTLFYIDPTGWTGFGLNVIKDIIKRERSEIIINFMYDFIQRFIGTSDQRDNFNRLFGNNEWEDVLDLVSVEPMEKEKQIIEIYKDNIKRYGKWSYVTNSKILYPEINRTYFHLIYATRALKGLREYKKIDNDLLVEQNKLRKRLKNGGQQTLFEEDKNIDPYYNKIFLEQRRKLDKDLQQELADKQRMKYDDILEIFLEREMVYEKDIKDILLEYLDKNWIEILDWSPSRRRPGDGDIIIWKE